MEQRNLLLLGAGVIIAGYLWSTSSQPKVTKLEEPKDAEPRHDEATGFPDSTAPTYQPAAESNEGMTPDYTIRALGGGGSAKPF